jgi:alpha-tubulin suppressor-like RCC1 family protein
LIATPLLVAVAMFCTTGSAQAAGGSVMGWGENFYGQTGNGTPTKAGCRCLLTPTQAGGLSEVSQISGGTNHALALHSSGTVTAWGYNGEGELGNGTTSESATPVPVSGLANVVAVDAGYEHNLALLADGTVMAWGDNYFGELGVGGSDFAGGGPESCGSGSHCSSVPIPVAGLTDVVAIDAGYRSSAALLGNGTVVAWGYDYYGFLGNGTGTETGCECAERPVPVPGVSSAVDISSDRHGMALLANGTVTAWGQDTDGQIGNGTDFEAPPPECLCLPAVSVVGLAGPVRQIDAGGYHSVALLGSGIAQAWGYNYEGELGNGIVTTEGCTCIPAAGSPVLGLAAQSLSAGEYHSLELLADGSVWAWGYNSGGQLGDGSEEERSAPVPVGGVAGASEVSAGEATSFALVGPSHALTVSLAGAGAGSVGGPGGILCPAASCVGRSPDGQVQILRAEPAPGSGFAGFTGACAGTGACRVTMDADKAVTATFGPPKGTQITKAKITQGKKKKKAKASSKSKRKPTARAKFSFTAPGAVSGFECMLVKPKPKKSKGKKKKKKRKKPKFSRCSSPKQYKKLKKGRYTFKVRAVNILGADANPAVRKFRIKR